jgi:hypothetical protein
MVEEIADIIQKSSRMLYDQQISEEFYNARMAVLEMKRRVALKNLYFFEDAIVDILQRINRAQTPKYKYRRFIKICLTTNDTYDRTVLLKYITDLRSIENLISTAKLNRDTRIRYIDLGVDHR